MRKTRAALKLRFQTGMTPTEQDFIDLFESLYNYMDDGVLLAGDDGVNIEYHRSYLLEEDALYVLPAIEEGDHGKSFQIFPETTWKELFNTTAGWDDVNEATPPSEIIGDTGERSMITVRAVWVDPDNQHFEHDGRTV